ncbi:hypothetical protein GQ53DRAFT_875857 [Thozetella sp. PMI_491]|nr:hypothetical protein GQ53DRAFT_875857 [Thozetella sp. PMI_491]
MITMQRFALRTWLIAISATALLLVSAHVFLSRESSVPATALQALANWYTENGPASKNPSSAAEASSQDWKKVEIDGGFNGEALQDICSEGNRPWTPDIAFDCPPRVGGIGNVRMTFLNCLRLAIGARGSFILPQVITRSETNLSFVGQGFAPFDYFFDPDHFRQTLQSYCPQLTLYDTFEDFQQAQNGTAVTVPLDPKGELGGQIGMVSGYTMAKAERWPSVFDSWLAKKDAGRSVHIALGSQWNLIYIWPTAFDRPDLVRTFSGLMRPNRAIPPLAFAVLDSLERDYAVQKGPFPGSGNFVGLHLRTEMDAVKHGFATYEVLAKYYKKRLFGSERDDSFDNSTVVYVASGDPQSIARFKKDFEPLRVVTKYDILTSTSLSPLTFDQQALVDMLVLERSAYFFGSASSSYSWLLALRRAAAVNNVVGGYPKPAVDLSVKVTTCLT